MRMRPLAVLWVLMVFPAGLRAQTATIIGAVLRDTAGHEVGGAQVLLPDLNRGAVTNYLGAFKFDKLAPGRHAILIRAVGFSPLFDTVEVAAGATVERDFLLQPSKQQAVMLDSVRVTAPEKKYISPGLQEFEERRKQGFGHFITEDVLRKNDNTSTLTNVIVSHVPGIKQMPGGRYVASARKCGNGPAILGCGKITAFCPPTLYIDGALAYEPSNDPNMRFLPDFTRMPVNEYAAVEYYAGGATMPAKYNRTSAGCGALILWTRER